MLLHFAHENSTCCTNRLMFKGERGRGITERCNNIRDWIVGRNQSPRDLGGAMGITQPLRGLATWQPNKALFYFSFWGCRSTITWLIGVHMYKNVVSDKNNTPKQECQSDRSSSVGFCDEWPSYIYRSIIYYAPALRTIRRAGTEWQNLTLLA